MQFYLLNLGRLLEWSYEIGSVHLCLLISVWVFSWDWIIEFFWILACCQKPLTGCVHNTQFCGKTFFATKIGEIGFFEFKEKFGQGFSLYLFFIENFYLLCSCTNPLGKILFLRYRPKSSQPIRLQDFSWANWWNSRF